MKPLRRRLRPVRKLARPGRPELQPLPRAEAVPITEASTEFNVPAAASPSLRAQDSTVEMVSVQAEIVREPGAPPKLEFLCACGAKLIATTETYDKNSRCAMCQTVMLLSLVYDPDRRSYEIVPFRINPESGP